MEIDSGIEVDFGMRILTVPVGPCAGPPYVAQIYSPSGYIVSTSALRCHEQFESELAAAEWALKYIRDNKEFFEMVRKFCGKDE